MLDWLTKLMEILEEYGVWGLGIASFADSSFSPLPPDFILIPLGIANPHYAFGYALVTVITSVLGALFGWWIGKKLGRPVLTRLFGEKRVIQVEGYFNRFGGFALFVGGLTPIPYKIFTIASGVFSVKKREVLFWSTLARSIRFFLEASIIVWFGGPAAETFIADNFSWITIIVAAVILLAIFLYQKTKKRRHT
ncbi:YqaA family protein [Mechercharimyces sp. CAU 1602]|uniref:YqaA family protein n=1 Tax=Mechercharimyces sp. CAU 1602 TaxID=2973933 RepID=UPI002161E962|nr:VTT domain-containing protein [Mechercharimyces sp. CAU 1602]MCS1350517.1 VTT domain-containing protein [Mechercharimyces sp. CAU 1602]